MRNGGLGDALQAAGEQGRFHARAVGSVPAPSVLVIANGTRHRFTPGEASGLGGYGRRLIRTLWGGVPSRGRVLRAGAQSRSPPRPARGPANAAGHVSPTSGVTRSRAVDGGWPIRPWVR